MAEVVLENVSRVYPGGTLAVDSIDLHVHDREFLVLVGPSGCGKSTTLRMIAGLEEVTEGEIRIAGRVVNDVAPRDRDIAMVFQNYALYPHMTVRKNMAFGLELRYGGAWPVRLWRRLWHPSRAAELAARRGEIGNQVAAAAKTLGIEHLLDRLPRQLSGGERQRVALGRAIVRMPAAFLFDEPLSNLDAKLRVDMRKELKQLHRRLGTTMIYVTHDQVEALTLGERIAVMDRGKIQQIGPAMEIYGQPKNRFVAGFVGTPPMNFLEGEWRETDGRLQLWVMGRAMAIDHQQVAKLKPDSAGTVVVGIRPEHVLAGQSAGWDAVVSVVEPLGDTSLVHFELLPDSDGQQDGKELVGKVSGQREFRAGQKVCVDVDAKHVHLFDADSGERLALQ